MKSSEMPRFEHIDRRRFLQIAAGISAYYAFSRDLLAAGDRQSIPYRKLGRTGEEVSLVGLGGFHIGLASNQGEATAIVRSAVDRGINFMDNCWDYHDGKSEVWMGNALRDGYRDKVFQMTKIDGRNKETAARQIDESLSRLQTDHIDLLQLHEIIRLDDPDRIFAVGGAIEAVEAAKKAGKIRYVGFTGHKSPNIHLKMLAMADQHNYRFDAVQMPLNVMDAHYNSFEKLVLPKLVEKEIGVLGMKSLGGSGEIIKSKTIEAIPALHYAMNLPVSVVITGCEKMEILDQAIAAAKTFRSMDEKSVAKLLSMTQGAAAEGKFELYKTETKYDGTHAHPEWLG